MSPGACITACRGTGRHIVALEGNEDIYNAILRPMRKSSTSAVAITTPVPVVEVTHDPEEMPVVPRKFVRLGKLSK